VIASSLPTGAEVLCPEEDFSSLLYPFLVRADVRVRCVPLGQISEAIDERTALVAVSAGQSADGRVADLDAIADAADRYGALTLVDATQAVGWLPLDARRFDFLVAGAYKWVLAPRGSAFLAIRRERLANVPPLLGGWYAAPGAQTGEASDPSRGLPRANERSEYVLLSERHRVQVRAD